MGTLAEHIATIWLDGLTAEERARMDELAIQVGRALKWLHDAVQVVGKAMIQAIDNVEKGNERQELLHLYRGRHSWKKADVGRINTYRLSKVGRNRVARLKETKLRGRGTTVPYVSWFERLALAGHFYNVLLGPDTPPHQRLRLLKQHRSWWPEFVAMTYRGEYERLKREGVRAPAEAAERAVGQAYAISVSYVRRLCTEVRKDPISRIEATTLRSMTVAQFESWKITGRLPQHLDGEVAN